MNERNPFLEEENPFLQNIPEKTAIPKKKELSLQEKNEYLNSIDPLHMISKKIQDIGTTFGQDINKAIPAIGRMLVQAPSELAGIGSQLASDKPRLARSLTLGAGGNILNALINTPPALGHLLHHYGLAPDIAGKMPYANFSPEIQKYLIGGERQPGDVLASNWPLIAQGISGARKLFGGGNEISGNLPVPPELTAATEAHTEAARAAQKSGLPSSPESIEHRIGKQRENITNLDNEITDLNNKINEIKVPHSETGREEPFEHAANLENAAKEEKNNITHAEALHENAQRESNNIESAIGHHLHTGAEHHVRAARLLKSDLEKLKGQNNKNYDTVKDELIPLNINIDNTPRIENLNKSVRELVSKGDLGSKEMQSIGKELTSLSKMEQIPAPKYISAYKALKGYVRDAYERAYAIGENEDTRVIWRERAAEANKKLDEMEEVLKSSLPENVYDNLKNADSFWKNNIMPLYDERLYWQIMKGEKLPKHMAEALAGGVTGSGKDIINKISKNNPKILKHIMGERWDTSDGRRNILNPNERMQSYLNDMPLLQALVTNHKRSQDSIRLADHALQGAKFHHNVINERLSNAKKIREREQGAIDKSIIKRNEKMIEKEGIQKSVMEKRNERRKIRKSIEEDIKHMEKLYETRNKKESLEKSFKAQQEINKIKKQMSKKVSLWKRTGYIAKGVIMGEFGLRELRKLLKYFEGD